MSGTERYIPALGYRWLTRAYDPVVRWATRENTFKTALLDAAALAPGERALDLGCGTGTLAIRAALRAPASNVTGVDGDPDVLALARAKAARSGATIQFDHGRVDGLPYGPDSFDLVVSSLVFHHLSTDCKRRTLSEVSRVLRPGGRFVLADWDAPQNLVMRAAFLAVQLLDGFATTHDNFRGAIPRLIDESGLQGTETIDRFSTPVGTLAIWRCLKARGAVAVTMAMSQTHHPHSP